MLRLRRHAPSFTAVTTVLGIDAAWTKTQPSGVALIQSQADASRAWKLVAACSSYAEFHRAAAGGERELRPTGGVPDAGALLATCVRLADEAPAVVAIDLPLSYQPIVSRRVADNAVSRLYGGRKCGTHTPSAERPGPLSDDLRANFDRLGYGLATRALTRLNLIEVYPHPALVELTGAAVRLPYKIAKARAYWPKATVPERRRRLLQVWADITTHLAAEIEGVAATLSPPPEDAPTRHLKSYEDALDAVVCAWVGACAIEGRAKPFGDEDAAIWIPDPDVTVVEPVGLSAA